MISAESFGKARAEPSVWGFGDSGCRLVDSLVPGIIGVLAGSDVGGLTENSEPCSGARSGPRQSPQPSPEVSKTSEQFLAAAFRQTACLPVLRCSLPKEINPTR